MAIALKQVAKEIEEEGREVEGVEVEKERQKASLLRAVWSGSLVVGLVNIPENTISLKSD
jgi:hypothetical protein